MQVNTLKINRVVTSNRADWASGIKDFYTNVYSDPANNRHVQLDRLARLKTKADTEPHIALPRWVVERCRSDARSRASGAPGVDEISWKNILALPPKVVEHFSQLFENRINNIHDEFLKDWCTVLVTLILKIKRPETLDDLRPIALTSCLQKWYMACVIHLISHDVASVSRECIGFCKGRQTADIFASIQTLIQMKKQRGEGLVILQCDVRRAFDSIVYEVAEKTLTEDGCPTKLVLSVLRELSLCEMHPRFQNSNVDDPVLLEVGGEQGGSDTPELWKRITDAASRNARKQWVSEKLGILLRFEHPRKDDRVTHLYWADDFYMFAQSASEAARMFVILTEEVHKLHLTWKPSSLHAMNISSNIALGDWVIPVGDHDWTIRAGSKLVVFGVCIDSNACSSASFDHRLGQTIAHFEGRSKVLCNRRIPLKARIARFYETCTRALLYGCGTWTITDALSQEFAVCERRFLRRMMARKKSIEESWVHYLLRLDPKIDDLLFGMQIVPLLGQCLLAYFGWGGHVARLADTSVCKIIHCWRDSDWLRTSQEMINTVGTGDARPMQVVGRPRARWDNRMEQAISSAWRHLAQMRSEWVIMKFRAARAEFMKIGSRSKMCFVDWSASKFATHISTRIGNDMGGCAPLSFDVRLLMQSDNKQLVGQVLGDFDVHDTMLEDAVAYLRWMSHLLANHCRFRRWEGFDTFRIHQQRRFNGHADLLANIALDSNRGCDYFKPGVVFSPDCRLILSCDGACLGNPSRGSSASVLWLCIQQYCDIIAFGNTVADLTTSVQTEFNAECLAIQLVIQVVMKVQGLCD